MSRIDMHKKFITKTCVIINFIIGSDSYFLKKFHKLNSMMGRDHFHV
jgi:hypothetical protein